MTMCLKYYNIIFSHLCAEIEVRLAITLIPLVCSRDRWGVDWSELQNYP